MALRWKWNLNTTTFPSRSAAPPHRSRSRLLAIPSPWPGARRDCLGLPPRRSSSTVVSTTGIVPLYNGVRPLRPSAVRSPSSPRQEKDSGDDDVVSSLGGGGRGGGGEGDEAGGGDGREDDASMEEVQVCPLLKRKLEKVIPEGLIAWLEIIDVLAGNAAATSTVLLASLQKSPIIRFLLRLVAPFSEGTVLWGVVLIMDKRSDPSFSDSSSTTSTVVTNPVGDESSHSTDNDFYETASAPNNPNANSLEMGPVNVHNQETTIIHVHEQNDTTNQHPCTPLLPNTTPDVNKKGFLGFLYTLVWSLFTLYSALVTFSVTYPSSAKALVSFDDAWTKGICVINLMSCFGSVITLPFASRFKDGESTNDHDGFGIFIWALYLLLLVLIPEYFLTVHVYLHIPKWIVWSLGTVIFSLTVLPAVRYIEGQRPTVAAICEKYWKKLKCCCSTLLAPSGRQV